MADMARWREERLKQQRKEQAPRRHERERQRAETERSRERGQETRDRVRVMCTSELPCQWCGPYFTLSGELGMDKTPPTARVILTPLITDTRGHVTQHEVAAYACFECIQSLCLVTAMDTGMSRIGEQRKKNRAASAREDRAENRANQLPLFADDPQNPLLKDMQ